MGTNAHNLIAFRALSLSDSVSDLDSLQHRTLLLGPLPILRHLSFRLRLRETLAAHLPASSATRLPPADALLLLTENILLSRVPLYALSEWAAPYRPETLGLTIEEMAVLNDDRAARALDVLFDTDRASLLTEVVVRAVREFQVDLDRVHNDSTTLTLQGAYQRADGRTMRGKRTVRAAHGYNKDHRPDLKQLLAIYTVSGDGAVPVHYRTEDGNTNDSPTHRESWEAIHSLKGSAQFLYVADSKLCSEDNVRYIDGMGGRFLTVLPRTRKEDALFREHVADHELPWETVRRRPNPRRQEGLPDVWKAVESPIPAGDGFRLIWVWSSLMAEEDREAREAKIATALERIEELEGRLRSPKTKLRSRVAVEKAVGTAARWLTVRVSEELVAEYRQEKRGRPGKETRYVRREKVRHHAAASPKEEVIAREAKSDGMFPLLTNDRTMSRKDLLEAYRYQPRLEKRFMQMKTVYEAAPMLLKRPDRMEALCFVYFLVMLMEALVEREVRRGMAKEERKSLPLYPEGRACPAPTTDFILGEFDRVAIHQLIREGKVVKEFKAELTDRQRELLRLAGVPEEAYRT